MDERTTDATVTNATEADTADTAAATVTCPACDFAETFGKLREARECLDEHRRATGHDPTWELGRLDPGVERAGDEAGVCGRPECGDAESPLRLDRVDRD